MGTLSGKECISILHGSEHNSKKINPGMPFYQVLPANYCKKSFLLESLTFALVFDLNERQKQDNEKGKRSSGICCFLFPKSALAYNRQICRFFSSPLSFRNPIQSCKTAVVTGEGLNHRLSPVSRLSELLSQSWVYRHTRPCPINSKGFLQRVLKDRSCSIGSNQQGMQSRILFPTVDTTRCSRGQMPFKTQQLLCTINLNGVELYCNMLRRKLKIWKLHFVAEMQFRPKILQTRGP